MRISVDLIPYSISNGSVIRTFYNLHLYLHPKNGSTDSLIPNRRRRILLINFQLPTSKWIIFWHCSLPKKYLIVQTVQFETFGSYLYSGQCFFSLRAFRNHQPTFFRLCKKCRQFNFTICKGLTILKPLSLEEHGCVIYETETFLIVSFSLSLFPSHLNCI